MLLVGICGPAFVYIGFSLIQIFIDIYAGVFNSAFMKFIVMIIFTLIINILCDLGYIVIAWILVFIPIIMMTLVSSLLLRVFGLDPDETDLRKNVVNVKDDNVKDDNVIHDNLQEQYPYSYDKYKNDTRIDRDNLRKDLYDKIDNVLDLSSNSYDLSKNSTKYFIVDGIINNFAEQAFIKDIINSRLYNAIFTNSLKSNNDLYNNYIAYIYENGNSPNNSFLGLPMTPFKYSTTLSLNEFQTLSGDHEKYADLYKKNYKLDGFLLFKESKYNAVKTQLYGTNPTIDKAKIDIEIEKLWNKLSATEQATWNKEKSKSNTSNSEASYDYYNENTLQEARNKKYAHEILSGGRSSQNNQVCPANETPAKFKARTGLTCYEICPPGKEQDSTGQCVRACQNGTFRDPVTNTCKNRI
jgi:hypothetical protein